MYKALALLAMIGVANAVVSYDGFGPHVGVQSESTVRGFGNFATVSNQQKAVDSAFSSVRKYDTRVTNNAYPYVAAPAYAAPAYAAPAYAAPAYHHAPAAYAAPAIAAPAYHAPAAYAAPAYAAPVARVAAPVVARAAPAGLLGVAYSPVAPGVATLTFDGFGVHYGY